jgi:hypothetical protein
MELLKSHFYSKIYVSASSEKTHTVFDMSHWDVTNHITTLMHLYHDIPEPLKFNGNDLSNVLRKDPSMQNEIKQDQNLPNLHGIYHDQYKLSWWNTHCYYACKPSKEYVHAPPKGNKLYDSISSIPELQKECDTIGHWTQRVSPWCHHRH